MNIVIYEPCHTGHRLAYVRRIVLALADLGLRPIVITRLETINSTEFSIHIRPYTHLCDISTMDNAKPDYMPAQLFSNAWALKKVISLYSPYHLYVPYADGLIQCAGAIRSCGLFGSIQECELEAIMFRGRFAHEYQSLKNIPVKWKLWLSALDASPFNVIHHTDIIFHDMVHNNFPRLSHRLRYLPDPIDLPNFVRDKITSRKILGIPEDGRYIGCVGLQDVRKGVDKLIYAFLNSDLYPNDRLLLAGVPDETIKEIASAAAKDAINSSRIIPIFRHLSEEEFSLSISALDVLCAPYPQERGHCGPSSIVIACAAYNKFCLGTRYGWIGHIIRRYGLGLTCEVSDMDDFRSAIAIAMRKSSEYCPSDIAKNFAAIHTTANFSSRITARLRERLGVSGRVHLSTSGM